MNIHRSSRPRMSCKTERASFVFLYFLRFTRAKDLFRLLHNCSFSVHFDRHSLMVYRDRQEGPPPGDPMAPSHLHDHYLDNCFLLCLNRDDQTDVPEIRRLENHLLRDLCQSHPVNRSPSQQQSRRYVPDQRRPMSEKNDFDEYPYDERNLSPRYPKENDLAYRRKDNQADYYP